MIRQHYLQQQRLNNNHDRLLQRFQHILTPQISEFRTLGRTPLPGRNYDQYIDTVGGHAGGLARRNSLVSQSRASIGSSSETYRLMGGGANEVLPGNIRSVMQHTREQPPPMVLAEKKFQPVAFYEHPVFGHTPAYVRPVSNDVQAPSDADSTEEEDDDDTPVPRPKSRSPSAERKSSVSTLKGEDDQDDDDDDDHAPLGYMSYKKWKTKYANLIPVNPLLYNIYTQRSHGSIHSYGNSLYAPRKPLQQPNRDDEVATPTISDVSSVQSDLPRQSLPSSNRQYERLQPRPLPSIVPSRPTADSDGDASDDESSSRDSPVPYLSTTRANPPARIPFPSIRPSTPPLAISTPITPAVPSTSIPPAPPMPASLLSGSTNNTYQTPSIIPAAPPLPPSTTNSIPPAPPMPASLLSGLPNSSNPATTSFPPAPASTSTSGGIYQAPSSMSFPSAPKAVTFGGSSSIPAPANDVSSSSDSDDDDDGGKKKRRRRRQKQAAAGLPVDSSSSD